MFINGASMCLVLILDLVTLIYWVGECFSIQPACCSIDPIENKRGPKRALKGHFFKSLKVPHYGVIKTLCAKNEVCKSISMTCSTYRRITEDKEENTPKWPKKGPQRAKNQNFEKQKIAFFSHVPRSIMSKN